MLSLLSLLLLASSLHASGLAGLHETPAPVPHGDLLRHELPGAFSQAAARHGVPEQLLLALAYEASHWRPDQVSAWGGVGLFDLREEGDGPQVEQAAQLAGISPDAIYDDPAASVDAAAALLAWQAQLSNDGVAPDPDELLMWWDAVRSFSGRHEPQLQDMYARYVFELVTFGLPEDVATGLELRPRPLDVESKLPPEPPMMMPGCDYSGCDQWVSASTANYSNYSRVGSDIQYVVIHTVQGSYSGCISWFQNSSASVSAHYVVRSSDGAVTQMVAEEDVAWHAGNWSYNLASVGIEHEGYVDDPGTWYTTAMYQGSAMLTADIISRTSASSSRSSIIGHVEVPGATHTDPGSGWDWDYYMDLVDDYLGGGSATGDVVGVVADSDIYNGERLVGATVWVAETGESTTSDADGYYRFYDLPLDAYTFHASFSGYDEGTCSKDLATGTNWCSIALFPGEEDPGGGDDTGGDTGLDTDEPVDTGGVDDGSDDGASDGGGGGGGWGRPGTPTDPDELGGCGCTTSPSAASGAATVLLVFGLAALRARREDV